MRRDDHRSTKFRANAAAQFRKRCARTTVRLETEFTVVRNPLRVFERPGRITVEHWALSRSVRYNGMPFSWASSLEDI